MDPLPASPTPAIQTSDLPTHIVLFDHDEPRAVRLRRRSTTIGAAPTSSAVIPKKRGAAWNMCSIRRSPDGIEIFNLTTAGALVVNGKTVEAAALGHGDELSIGGIRALMVNATAGVIPEGLQGLFLRADGQSATRRSFDAESSTPESFAEILSRFLKKTPLYAASITLHVVFFLILDVVGRPMSPSASPTIPPPPFKVDMRAILAEIDAEGPISDDQVLDALQPSAIGESPSGTVESDLSTLGQAPGVGEEIGAPSGAGDPTDPIAGFGRDDAMGDGMDGAPGSDVLGIGGPAGSGGGSGRGRGGADGNGHGGLGSGLEGNLPTGPLGDNIKALRASGLDIVVLLDSTGSMDDTIAGAKKKIGDMISLLETLGIEFRLGIVTYRDKGDDYVLRSEPLTALRFKAVSFLDTVQAGGGGDEPEAVYDALSAAVSMSWSTRAKRVIVVVGDAPPHEQDISRTFSLAKRFAEQKGSIDTVFTEGRNHQLSAGDVRGVFTKIADFGEGRAVTIDDESRIVEDIVCLALGTDDRVRVHQLMRDRLSAWDSKTIRARLDRGDADFVVKELTQKVVPAALARELLLAPKEALLPAYLRVLYFNETTTAQRWLAYCLLQRVMNASDRFATISRDARQALRDLNPDQPPARQKKWVETIAKGLIEARIISVESVTEIVSKPR